MKRIIAILLTAAMLVCLASCGEDKKTDAEKIVDDFNAELDDALKDLEDAVDDLDDALEDYDDYDDDDDDFKATSSEIVLGNESGNVYTNAFSGLEFELPDGWVFAPYADRVSLMDVDFDVTDRAELEKRCGEVDVIFDMIATGPNNESIQIVHENLELYGSADMTEEEYLNDIKKSAESASAYTVETGAVTTGILSGIPFSYTKISLSSGDETIYQDLFVMKKGVHMCCVMSVTNDAEFDDNVRDMFD